MRVGRYLDRGRAIGLSLGITGSTADAGYGTLALGLDLQIPGNPPITPTLGGRAGILVEEGFLGDLLEASVGLAVRVGAGKWIRVGAQVGRHSDADGPNGFLIGFEAPL